MDIKKLNEGLKKYIKEDIDFENEQADKKAKLRIYKKAYESLGELQGLLSEGVSPSTGKLDDETDAFYNKLTEMINEIYSRSLAFEN